MELRQSLSRLWRFGISALALALCACSDDSASKDLPQNAGTREGQIATSERLQGTLLAFALQGDTEPGGDLCYVLLTDEGEVDLLLTEQLASHLSPGDQVEFLGQWDQNSFRVEEIVSIQTANPGDPSAAYVTGEQRVLALLVNFQNTPQPSLTASQVTSALATLDSYYRENSYGNVFLTSSVRGWYTLPRNQTCTGIVASAIAAADPNVDFRNFNRLILIAPFGPSCGWRGYASLTGATYSTADGSAYLTTAFVRADSATTRVIGRQLGHNFGLRGSDFLECGSLLSDPAACQVKMGTDPYTVMGSDAATLDELPHFSAAQKDQLGWLGTSRLTSVTASGTYTIEALSISSSNAKALRIPRGDGSDLYVEYRRPVGFDVGLDLLDLGEGPSPTNVYSGPILRVVDRGRSLLVDPSPPGDVLQLALNGTYTDPLLTARLHVLSTSATAATLEVSLNHVEMVSPQAGATLSGVVQLRATVGDPAAVERVEYFVSGRSTPVAVAPPNQAATFNTELLTNGGYTFSAQTVGFDGSRLASRPISVTVANVDHIPPTVSLTAPVDGSTIPIKRVVVSANASDNWGVQRVDFYRDNDVLWATDTTAPYGATLQFQGDPTGPHTLYARAFDAAGNFMTSVTVHIEVQLEHVLPTVAITSPASGAYSDSGIFNVATNVTDNVGIDKVEFYRDAAVLLFTDTSAPYGGSLSLPTATEGWHTVYAKAYDLAGNVATSASIQLGVDRNPPVITVLEPAPNATVAGMVTIRANVSDAISGPMWVNLFVDNGATQLVHFDGPPYEFQWDSRGYSGANTIVINAADHVSRWRTVSVPIFIANDIQLPTVEILSPQDDERVHSPLTITADAQDNVGIDRVEFYCDSSSLPDDVDHDAPYSGTCDLSSFADGDFVYLRVVAYDTDQNSAEAWRVVEVDQTPQINFVVPAPESVISGNVPLEVAIETFDGTGSVDFYVDSHFLGNVSSPPYQLLFDSTILTDGPHTLYASVTDSASQVNYAGANVTAQNDIPSPIWFQGPWPGETVSGEIHVTLWSWASFDWMSLLLDDEWWTSVSPPSFDTTLATTVLRNGEHCLTATGYDSQGLRHTTRVCFVVDNHPNIHPSPEEYTP